MVFYRLAHGEKLKKAGHTMSFYRLAHGEKLKKAGHAMFFISWRRERQVGNSIII